MTSKEITDAVVNYIHDENAKYAILIDGAWGSGKTYLYENYLVDAINPTEIGKNGRKYNVYISLYGISTIASLSKQLISNYLIYVRGKGNKLIKKGIKPLAGIIGIASSAFSFSIGSVSVKLSDTFAKIVNSINVKDMVICFDDLERCTIPINEFFGFVNNLVEHCNCKVLILADEKNIGKIYANTNLEEKYLTVLSGNRKVVECIEEEKTRRIRNSGSGQAGNDEITVEELKKLNEILYSENYIYKDIKEKVIGRTMSYYPILKDVVVELIVGNEKTQGVVSDEHYKEYLLNHKDAIVNAFNETENSNLRIIRSWLISFRTIYVTTIKYYSKNRYLEEMLNDYLQYSIWAIGALKNNKKIIHYANFESQEMVTFEGHKYNHIYRYSFIDAWIDRNVWRDEDLLQACKLIIKRREREDVDNPPRIHSTGKALSELREWYLFEDAKVIDIIANLEKEIEENKYSYYDYSNIISYLLHMQEEGLYKGNLNNIKDIMINLIKNDTNIQEENEFPKDFVSAEVRKKYNELYRPISEERKERNRILRKENQEEENIYKNANSFLEHCKKMENYYCSHRSFIEYLNLEKLYLLINDSDNEGVYTICRAFSTIYFMGNLAEFYSADTEKLIEFRNNLKDESIINKGGITRRIAINSLVDQIEHDLMLLGVEES